MSSSFRRQYFKPGTYGTAWLDPTTGEVTYVLDNDDPDTQALAAVSLLLGLLYRLRDRQP